MAPGHSGDQEDTCDLAPKAGKVVSSQKQNSIRHFLSRNDLASEKQNRSTVLMTIQISELIGEQTGRTLQVESDEQDGMRLIHFTLPVAGPLYPLLVHSTRYWFALPVAGDFQRSAIHKSVDSEGLSLGHSQQDPDTCVGWDRSKRRLEKISGQRHDDHRRACRK